MIKKVCFIAILQLSICFTINAQQKSSDLTAKIESYSKAFPKEKLYLSTDKPYYNVGDTLWFKCVLLMGDHTMNTQTDKIYVELFNDSSKIIETKVISLNNGLGYGDFTLKDKLYEGTYTIRAYSNWQQNFGSDYFFQKSFYLGKVNSLTWLVDSYQKMNTIGAKKTLDLKIRLTNTKNEPSGLRDIEVYLMNEQKRVMRADLQTSLNGVIETQIPLGENRISGNYSFYIVDKRDKSRQAMLPIVLEELDEVDLQFMPEGGHMVNGIYGKIAFKAVGVDGRGKMGNLKILNTKNEVLAEASAIHNGMGSFYLAPQKEEKYSAVYTFNGKQQIQSLPIAKEEGTTLRIDHLSKPDSLLIYIKASDSKRRDEPYQLVAQTANENVLTLSFSLKAGFTTLKMAKINFPDGIIHFTLFSPDMLQLNERQAFINNRRKINLELKTSRENYSPRDSIALEVIATNEDGQPLSGTFALSVTDNGQIKQRTNEDNILSYFLLQSNIKGNIEEPSWYFRNEESSTLIALDHLLLTQGWVGYHWEEILKPLTVPRFKAEKDNIIEGRLTGLFNKPVANVKLTLLSTGKNFFVTDTISNSEGKFFFKDLPLIDSPSFSIKIKNAKGKVAAANIFIEEFKPAKDILNYKSIKPWYVNTDSTVLNYYKNAENQKATALPSKLKLEGNELKEVEIIGNQKEKAFIVKTAWDASLFKKIEQEELQKIPRKTLLDLLRERIEGLTVGDFYADGCFGIKTYEVDGKGYPPAGKPRRHTFTTYLIGQTPIAIVMIDKISTVVAAGYREIYQENVYNVSRSNIEPNVRATNTFIFNNLTAQDIKDITIYKGCNAYFLDITTYGGKGPWISPTAGIYVYRPIPLYFPREFYSPKYNASKSIGSADLRSTIYWDANVVTDENGKAKISFYAADLPGTYTVKIEGTDMFGRFGSQKIWIPIKNKTESK